MSVFKRPDIAGWQAIILHRPHSAVEALLRQLEMLHIKVTAQWPELDETARNADIIFFDADLGHDEQFPWPAGQAPMPMIALIGSEAPGRVQWALSHGSNAHLLKPIASTGAYSAILIASHAFEQAKKQKKAIQDLEEKIRYRQIIVRAVTKIMEIEKCDDLQAYNHLRSKAMDWRLSIEETAFLICEKNNNEHFGS